MSAPILSTARLDLFEATDADAAFVLELLNEPAYLANIGDRQVRDLADARGYIARRLTASYTANGFGLWRVARRDTGETVGMSGLIRRDGLDDPDIGYAFLERHWGLGYAKEAGRAVLAHALGPLGLPKVVAVTSLNNHASMAVLENIGLRFEAVIDLPGYDEPSRFFTT